MRGQSIKSVFFYAALWTLSACCKEADLPHQIAKLYSSVASERNEGALALARCGSKANEAVDRLSQLLYDTNIGVQSSAAYALRKIGTDRADAALEEATARRKKR